MELDRISCRLGTRPAPSLGTPSSSAPLEVLTVFGVVQLYGSNLYDAKMSR